MYRKEFLGGKSLAWLVCVVLFAVCLGGQSHAKIFPNEDYEEWMYDQNHNGIDDRLELLKDAGSTVDAAVLFNHCLTANDELFVNTYATVLYVGRNVQVIYARATTVNDLLTMKNSTYGAANVFRVEKLEIGQYSLDVSNPAIRAKSSTTYPTTAWTAGQTGAGIRIAILDSGVDDGHPAFAGKYVIGYDAELDQAINPDDNFGHGTHVAGIALGVDPTGPNDGVASGAQLIDVKVGTSAPSAVAHARAVDWCIDNRLTYNIRVLNMSYGLGGANDGKDVSSMYVDKAVDAGLVVCVAVGNSGQDNYVPSPASADRSIAVGALDDHGTVLRNDETFALFSNKGLRDDDGDDDHIDEEKPDVVAPGVNIMSAQYAPVGQSPLNTYVSFSGTSMASPHVAGVAVILIGSDPTLTPDDVKAILRSTSTDQTQNENPAYTHDWGKGEVDAYRTLCTGKPAADLYGQWQGWDIYSASYPAEPQANVLTTLYAKVRNHGPNAANGVIVLFFTNVNNVGYGGWTQIGQAVINVPSGSFATASIPWTPLPGHQCLRTRAVYCNDPDHSNDEGQQNFNPHQSTFYVEAGAPVPYPHEFTVTIDASDVVTDSGWFADIRAEDSSFEPIRIDAPGAYQIQIPRDNDHCPCIIKVDMHRKNNCSLPGDPNNDLAVNIGDAVHLINYIFKGGPPPVCTGKFSPLYLEGLVNDSSLAKQTILTYEFAEGDANNDITINVGDAVYLINYIFKGGPPPIGSQRYNH